jgi:hypothetical protein
MITMKMADKNMVYPLNPDSVPSELYLGCFPAVDKVERFIKIKQLGTGVSFGSW